MLMARNQLDLHQLTLDIGSDVDSLVDPAEYGRELDVDDRLSIFIDVISVGMFSTKELLLICILKLEVRESGVTNLFTTLLGWMVAMRTLLPTSLS